MYGPPALDDPAFELQQLYWKAYPALSSRSTFYLPSSILKSNFSRLLERSAEVLALNSVFHSALSRGGMLINLALIRETHIPT